MAVMLNFHELITQLHTRREDQMERAIQLRERKEKERQERPLFRPIDTEPKSPYGNGGWVPPIWTMTPSFNPEILDRIRPRDCNPQVNSPLFSKLPAEIRQLIYEFVFEQYEGKSTTYRNDQPYYRPGSTAPKCISTALLYTCRLVLVEARFIPLHTATHEFWRATSYPRHTTELRYNEAIPANLSIWHFAHMRHFHINMSAWEFFLQSSQPNVFWRIPTWGRRISSPKTLTVCIGYTDWDLWQWGMEPQIFPINHFHEGLLLCGVQEFTLKLETMEVFAKELDDIVHHLRQKKIRFHRDPNYPYHLSTDGIPLKVTRWTGPHSQSLKKAWVDDIKHLGPEHMKLTEVWYYIVEVTWRPRRVVEPLNGH